MNDRFDKIRNHLSILNSMPISNSVRLLAAHLIAASDAIELNLNSDVAMRAHLNYQFRYSEKCEKSYEIITFQLIIGFLLATISDLPEKEELYDKLAQRMYR